MPFPLPSLPRSWLLRGTLALALWAGGAALSPGLDFVPTFGQRNWHQGDGLPGNEVNALCQDRAGFLWVTTPAGLARFDGTRFVRFERTAGPPEADPGFTAILADPANDGLWVAPRAGGLLRLDAGKFAAHPLPAALAAQPVTGLLLGGDGALWIGFRNGAALRQHRGTEEIFDAQQGLSATHPIHLATDGAGRVWLANGTLLARYDRGALTAVPLGRRNEELRLASACRDGPWVFTRGWLLKVIDGELADVTKISSDYNAYSLQACLEDSTGALWMGSRSRGLRRLTLQDKDSRLAIRTPEDISAVLEDSSGNLWAGSNGGGLVRVRAGIVQRYDKFSGLLENHSLAVCQDPAGTIWFANRDGGVAFINELGRVLTLQGLPVRDTFSVWTISPARPAGVWAASSHGLLRAIDRRLQPPDEPGAAAQPKERGEVRVSHSAANGDLWLALGPGRLGRLRDGEWTLFGADEGLGSGAVLAIAESADGIVWAAGEEAWVCRLEGDRFVRQPLSPPASVGAIQALHFDAAGNGWLGTEGGGVLHLGTGGARALDARHGLPASNITQVIGDDHGAVWFGSPVGIFHLRREELQEFFAGRLDRVEPVLIGADEGLAEATCLGGHQPSTWKSRDGTLWFATRQGVVAVDPRREKTDRTPLAVKVGALRQDGRARDTSGPVRLSADAHALEVDYSTLCLSTPERVRTRLRLQGFDEDWTRAPASGVARYTRLPPGEYRFEVAAVLAGVPRSEASDSLAFVIEAAWWQTPWFRAAALAAGLFLIVLAARVWSHRRLRARVAKLEHDSALEQDRARIAQNIHDELGSGLTRISLLTQSGDAGDGRAQLDKIYNTVSGLTQSMDEIVWAVNPKHDDLESLANYLAEYAQGFLTDAGLRCRVLLPDFLPARGLTTQFRHHLFLACKEALNNVAKHAQATEVSVRLRVEHDLLTIVVADNGRGFPAAAAPRGGRAGAGNGVANMRARLAALGGSCEIASAGAGTTVTFTAVLTRPPALP